MFCVEVLYLDMISRNTISLQSPENLAPDSPVLPLTRCGPPLTSGREGSGEDPAPKELTFNADVESDSSLSEEEPYHVKFPGQKGLRNL
jgi:hypothetical protein